MKTVEHCVKINKPCEYSMPAILLNVRYNRFLLLCLFVCFLIHTVFFLNGICSIELNLEFVWPFFTMLLCVLLGIFHESLVVLQKFLGHIGTHRVLGLRIVDEGNQRLYHLIRFRCRLPVFGTDYGQTYLTLIVDIWMVYLRFERDLWWLEWVLWREVDFNAERAFGVRRIFLIIRRKQDVLVNCVRFCWYSLICLMTFVRIKIDTSELFLG